jgi:hypothetical protein
MTPYEYHNEQLGVQARFLFSSDNASKAHENSLGIMPYATFNYRVKNDVIKKLRPNGPSSPMLVTWESLPMQWQTLLIKAFGEPKEKARKSLFEKNYERDTKAMLFYSSHLVGEKHLTNDEIEEYTVNASVLNLIDKMNRDRLNYRKQLKGEVLNVWQSITNDANRFKDSVAHTLPEYGDYLKRKLNKYKSEGYASLISGKKMNNNARKVTPEIVSFLNNLFSGQTHKPTYTEVSRQYNAFLSGYREVINNDTGEAYDAKALPKISTSTIAEYLSDWENEIGNEAKRSGDRQKLMQKFKPYHSLQQPTYAGSIISVDDRQPPFEYAKGKRMWFYLGIDLASEAITTWVYGKTKEGIIIDFYRQMIRNYAEWGLNLPAELEAESSLNSSFKHTFLKEGAMFQYVRIEANNARGKRIERHFREMRYEVEKQSEGWIARPFARSEANQASGLDVPLIPINELVESRLRDIEKWQNTEHSKTKGKTRWEYFMENQHPDLQPTNYRAILPYLGYKTETSCNAGIIRLQGKEFVLGNESIVFTGEKLIASMKNVEGRAIDIYWIDGNDQNVLKALVYIGDQFYCEAIPKPIYSKARIEQTPKDLEAREIMSAYTATVDGYMARQKRKLDAVTIIEVAQPTLNTKFKMPGLSNYEVKEHEAAEILPDMEASEYELITTTPTVKRSLKDKF